MPGFPKYYGIFVYVVPPTEGSVFEYSSVPRAPIFELGNAVPFSAMVGHTWRYTFYGRVSTGTFDVVPNLWPATGQMSWLAGQPKKIGDYVLSSFPNTYRATSNGVTGPNPPSGKSNNEFDGGVTWEYVGNWKGRAYDIYESGPNAGAGAVYASTYTGAPHTGAACTLTTTFSKYSVLITVPSPGYTNITDYVGSGDDSRTFLSNIDSTEWGGNDGGGGIGLDFVRLPPAGLQVDLSHFSVTREDPSTAQ